VWSVGCCLPACLQWELDLHGLHVSEALAALQRRLDLLEGGQGQGQGQQQQHPQPISLHVIVGRGSHSVDGDSSLARQAEAFLQQRSYRIQWRGRGALDVRLKRQRWQAAGA
jgi:DNA-nicking Smr family endonuclease